MSCERFAAAVAAHAAGGRVEGTAAAHLDGCAACQQRVTAQRRLLADVDAELERALAIEASPEFTARVTRSLGVAKAARSRAWLRPVWAGLAAAACIALAMLLRQGPASRGAVPASDVRLDAEATGSRPAAAAPDVLLKAEAARSRPAAGPSDVRLSAGAIPDATRRGPVVSAFSRKPSGPPRGDAAAEQPPVIVEPAQALAIARLYELLRQGRLTEEALSPGPPHDTAELSVEPLRIPEITVPDLEAAGRAPGSALERD